MAAISWKSGVGGDWATAADWSSGTVPGAGDDVTVGATGTYTVTINEAQAAKSLTVKAAGATVTDNSTLTMGGALTLTAGTFQLNGGGVIGGGTMSATGGVFAWDGGTLNGVTYDGTLDMSAATSVLHIGANGLVAKNAAGTGPGTINLTGTSSQLVVVNNQTLDKATINIGGAANYAYLYDYDTNGASHTLTLGSGLTIDQTGVYAELTDYSGQAGDGFVNEGKITAGVNGGQFFVNAQSFANQGTIAVSNGDTLTLNDPNWSNTGSITVTNATAKLNGAFASSSLAKITNNDSQVIIGGTVTNSAPALSVGTGTKLGQLTLASSGLINGGTIKDAGTGFVWSGGTLDGVTYEGTLDMSATSSSLRIGIDGLVAKNAAGTGPGTINLTGTSSQLVVVNNQTLDKATINIGGATNYAYLYDYDTNGASHTLTLGSGLTIDQTGVYAALADYSGQAGDGFVNEGKISAEVAGGRFTIQSQSFDNLGSIAVANGDALTLQPANLVNFAAGTLTGGTFEADAGSTFQLLNNTFVTTLDATVILNGAGSVLQSLNTTGNVQTPIDATLTAIGKSGTLEVLGDRNWTSTKALSNAGALVLGGGAFDPASLTNTGTLSGYGVIATTVTNHGVVAAAASQVLSFLGGKLTNLVGTTLTGGQFIIGLNGTIELANNVQVVSDSALITLNGASSKMQSFSTSGKAQVSLDSTLASITAAGTLELLGNRNWSSTNAMTNAGALVLGGGAFAPASLTSTGTVSGYGVIDTVFANNGALAVAAAQTMSLVGGTLKNLAGTTLTGGTYTVGTGATLQLANNGTITTLGATMTLNKSAVVQSLNTASSMQVSLESSLTTIEAAGELALLGARGYSTTNAIANSGTLDLAGGTFKSGKLSELAGSTLTGFGTVTAVVANAGLINAAGGTLAFSGAITGAGSVTIAGGAASFASTFTEAVTFKTSGTLTLAHSLAYTGKISGFSLTGATSLDLRDVGFVSASEATFSGTASGGVLTVSDGTHTAKINLVGNYTGSTFTASSDGSGGVIVVDPTPGAPRTDVASPPAFVSAMAALGSGHAASASPHPGGWRPGATTLSLPRPSLA
jgi:fibronectin-binding autotransporter adhesin